MNTKNKRGGPPTPRASRYGKLIRGWAWRTSQERLTLAEERATCEKITKTELLERSIDEYLMRNNRDLETIGPGKIMFCGDCTLMGVPVPENNDTCGNCGSHNVVVYFSNDQRQRDAAALDAFAQALSMCNINLRRYDADGEHVSKLPAFANWREMMVWIRENFPPTRPA